VRSAISRADLVEGVAALVISIAAAMTSWVSFQASLWDGEQAAHYAQAGAARTAAAKLTTVGATLETADLLMFQQWLAAATEGDAGLATFYRKRFRPEFAPAFEAWLKTAPMTDAAAPPTPFAMPQYRSARMAMARDLEKQADALFERGQKDNDVSDHFVRGAVLLAVALFFGGISQSFKSLAVKIWLIVMAVVMCVVCGAQIAHLPILSLS